MEKIGCVVLAAGMGKRFGSDKLLLPWEGGTLLSRALEAVPGEEFEEVVVITRTEAGEAAARAKGFSALRNNRPELGQSRSLILGLRALTNPAAVLFQVADQPWLRRETVKDLIRFYRQQPEKIAALSHGGVRGNPCVFPAAFFPELLRLTGDRGGSAVIRAHTDALRLLEAPERELRDIDTWDDFEKGGRER